MRDCSAAAEVDHVLRLLVEDLSQPKVRQLAAVRGDRGGVCAWRAERGPG
jgi:hypothetical protein